MDEDEIEDALAEIKEALSGVETALSLFETEALRQLSLLREDRSALSELMTQVLERLARLEERR